MCVLGVRGAGAYARKACADRAGYSWPAWLGVVITLLKPPEKIDDLTDKVNKEELSNQEHGVAPFPVAPDTALGSSSLSIGVGGSWV